MDNKKIAAIDIGTNSFHMIIVNMSNDKSFEILDKKRIVMRLASGQGNELKYISDDEMAEAVKILNNFAKLAKKHNAIIRAVATSAVRESQNGNEFVKKVFEETSINTEVIDGQTEANLIYSGIKHSLDIDDKKVLCIDIGGGSTEFIYSDNGKIKYSESVKIGAVRLSKMFFPDFIITDSAIQKCSEYVEQQIINNKNINLEVDIDFSVGVSGTVDSIFFITQFTKYGKINDQLNGYTYSKEEFDQIYNMIMALKYPVERSKVKGMEARRADIIPAGLIILSKIFELFKFDKIKISEYALREGTVFDTFDRLSKDLSD